MKIPFSRHCPDRLWFHPASSLTSGEIRTDEWNVILIIHSLVFLRCDTRRSYPSCFGSSLRGPIYRLVTLLCHESSCGPRNVETNRKCQLGRNEATQNCGKCRNKWRVSCVSVLSETNVKWNILYRPIITSVPNVNQKQYHFLLLLWRYSFCTYFQMQKLDISTLHVTKLIVLFCEILTLFPLQTKKKEVHTTGLDKHFTCQQFYLLL